MDLQAHVDLVAELEGRVNPGGLVGHGVGLGVLEKASLEAGAAPLMAVVLFAATLTLALDWIFVEIR